MLQVYVDESGAKGQGTLFVFSALLARAEVWVSIVDQWQAVLAESPSIQYFKMAAAKNRSGQFRGFSEAERDDKVKKLGKIINTPDITEFAFTLVLKDFLEEWAPRMGRPACEPYFIPFQFMNLTIGFELARTGETQPAEVFFDEHVIFGPKAKVWYPIVRETAPPEIRPLMPVEPFFRSDKDVLPLQAADLTAWIRRIKNSEGLQDFEWLESELNQVQHSPLGGKIDSAWIQKMLKHEYSPEEQVRHEDVMRAYRETFGFEFPPEGKVQQKKHRGK